jgi:hypothetical protein
MKAKGVGELGLCGANAAVANAIYNATGVRVRDYRSRSTSCWSGCLRWPSGWRRNAPAHGSSTHPCVQSVQTHRRIRLHP